MPTEFRSHFYRFADRSERFSANLAVPSSQQVGSLNFSWLSTLRLLLEIISYQTFLTTLGWQRTHTLDENYSLSGDQTTAESSNKDSKNYALNHEAGYII